MLEQTGYHSRLAVREGRGFVYKRLNMYLLSGYRLRGCHRQVMWRKFHSLLEFIYI